MIELIGGHEGVRVARSGGVVSKSTDDPEQLAALRHEWETVRELGGWPAPRALRFSDSHAPELVAQADYADLGPCQPVADGEALRRQAIALLAAIRSRGWRHGDLTGPQQGNGESNLIWDGSRLWAVDWSEAHRLGEPAPQKSPWSDSWLLARTLSQWADVAGQADTPRVMRRWGAVLEDLGARVHRDNDPLPLRGKLLVDFGTYMGDFAALAACEGMHAIGVDRGGFRSGEDSIEIGRALWAGGSIDIEWPAEGVVELVHGDIMDSVSGSLYIPPGVAMGNVALCFSTWPYLVAEYGEEAARSWLAAVLLWFERLYFETQLAGDGPGPASLPDVDAVDALLHDAGATDVRRLVDIPVVGRDAVRSVFVARRLAGI